MVKTVFKDGHATETKTGTKFCCSYVYLIVSYSVINIMPSSKEGHSWNSAGHKTGLLTDSVIDGTPQTEILDRYDVVIIGAGFAGLVAARNLGRVPNTKILLLDGRDRIGGRTWTAKSMGEEFEMGGTWVHW